jgi:hypothetical protein
MLYMMNFKEWDPVHKKRSRLATSFTGALGLLTYPSSYRGIAAIEMLASLTK